MAQAGDLHPTALSDSLQHASAKDFQLPAAGAAGDPRGGVQDLVPQASVDRSRVRGQDHHRAPPRAWPDSVIAHDGRSFLAGLPQGFAATKYHSLIVDEGTLPRS